MSIMAIDEQPLEVLVLGFWRPGTENLNLYMSTKDCVTEGKDGSMIGHFHVHNFIQKCQEMISELNLPHIFRVVDAEISYDSNDMSSDLTTIGTGDNSFANRKFQQAIEALFNNGISPMNFVLEPADWFVNSQHSLALSAFEVSHGIS